eukprot:COSAG05_NODE_1637_length_4363_cov_2.634146_9_plen_38_part_01
MNVVAYYGANGVTVTTNYGVESSGAVPHARRARARRGR